WRGWVERRDRVPGGEFDAAGRSGATSIAVRLTSEIAGTADLVSVASACGRVKSPIPFAGLEIGTAVASVSFKVKSASINRFPATPTTASETAEISQKKAPRIGRKNLWCTPFSTRRVKETRLRDFSP